MVGNGTLLICVISIVEVGMGNVGAGTTLVGTKGTILVDMKCYYWY